MLTERATFGLIILILYEKFNNMHMYITQTSFHFDIFMIFSILNAYIHTEFYNYSIDLKIY